MSPLSITMLCPLMIHWHTNIQRQSSVKITHQKFHATFLYLSPLISNLSKEKFLIFFQKVVETMILVIFENVFLDKFDLIIRFLYTTVTLMFRYSDLFCCYSEVKQKEWSQKMNGVFVD